MDVDRYFSPAVATEENRRIFASNIFSVYRTYDLDGIDIDWEYPGHEGDDGNLYSPLDTSNFLAFLKVLRLTLPGSAKISAAVQTIPFLGPDGDPIPDTSEFGEVFDWILLMNYDTWEG
jgi:chitinase